MQEIQLFSDSRTLIFMHYAQLLYACTIFNTNIHAHWRLTTMRKCGIISLSRENKKRLLQMRSSGDCDPCPLILPFLDACFKISFLEMLLLHEELFFVLPFIAPRLTMVKILVHWRAGDFGQAGFTPRGVLRKGVCWMRTPHGRRISSWWICWLLRGEAVAVKLVGWLHIPARGRGCTPRIGGACRRRSQRQTD